VQNPTVEAAAGPKRHPLRLAALVAAGIVLVAGLAAVVLFLWLRTYAPLDAAAGTFGPGPGLGADVQPVTGSGGKPVYIPAFKRGRPFYTLFTLENTGRFTVTVSGLVRAGGPLPPLSPETVLASDSYAAGADPSHLHTFESLRLDPHDTAILVVRWHLNCRSSSSETSSDTLRLRYRYLSTFTRTASVELPFAVTLRCEGGPPPVP
jgi:hypothetical protein